MISAAKVPALRRAVAQDAAAVAVCVNSAYSPWIERIGRTPWPMLQDYAAIVAADHGIVAEQCGSVVGVLVLRETDEGFLLENVAVLPSLKGQGVGKALLVCAEQEALKLGHDSLYLFTHAKMLANIALYSKLGYVEYERRQQEGFVRVFLKKALP